MKQYLLSIYQPTGGRLAPEDLEKVMAEVGKLASELKDAGAWVFAAGLADPSTSTVLRPGDSGILMTDGPFAEGKEHLGGFNVVNAPDLDEALGWGRKLAQATGLPIEVRPLQHVG
jgi:hypothetical protein